FAYFLLQHLPLAAFDGGAAVPTLDRNVLHELEVLIPSHSVLSKFDGLVDPVFAQSRNLEKQNTALIRSRDLLLPRLMDGTVRFNCK
ncbi:MAG: restriction endonuclease subunit S, partial [Parvibaculales bacterium]